jgi:hypothetical protein
VIATQQLPALRQALEALQSELEPGG